MKTLENPGIKPCRIEGCTHAPFEGKYAAQAEQLHFHRVHSKKVRVPGQGRRKYKKRRVQATARFNVANGNAKFNGLDVIPMRKDGQPDRRSHAWKATNGHVKVVGKKRGIKTQVHQQAVNWCPNCSTDLVAVARAMVITGQTHLHVNCCPSCGCNVAAVAEELAAGKLTK